MKQFATIAVLVLAAVACRAAPQESLPFFAVDPSTSPRMSALRSAVEKEDGAAVGQFWDEVREKHAPLIEPVPNDNNRSLVTFLWKGNADTHNVIVIGGVAGTELTKNLLSNIHGTDVWYKTYNVRNDARFIYSLSPNDSLQPIEKIDPKDRAAMRKRLSDLRPDPFNPQLDPGGMPSSTASLARSQEIGEIQARYKVVICTRATSRLQCWTKKRVSWSSVACNTAGWPILSFGRD